MHDSSSTKTENRIVPCRNLKFSRKPPRPDSLGLSLNRFSSNSKNSYNLNEFKNPCLTRALKVNIQAKKKLQYTVQHTSCDTLSTFDSYLENFNENEFFKDLPPIEYEDKLRQEDNLDVYSKHKKRINSLSRSVLMRKKSDLCLKIVNTDCFGLKLY